MFLLFSRLQINLFPMKIMLPKQATSKTWTRTLDLDTEKPEINIGLKNMSDLRDLCLIKTIRNCLKVRVLTDI